MHNLSLILLEIFQYWSKTRLILPKSTILYSFFINMIIFCFKQVFHTNQFINSDGLIICQANSFH